MIKDFKVGDRTSFIKVFTEEDLEKFSRITTDRNELHFDEDYAKVSIFGKRILPGMLTASLFSALVGNHLPGRGGIYLGQTISFRKPVFINDEITASAEITKIKLRILITNHLQKKDQKNNSKMTLPTKKS